MGLLAPPLLLFGFAAAARFIDVAEDSNVGILNQHIERLEAIHAVDASFSVVFTVWLSEARPSASFTIDIFPTWAPEGAARFRELVAQGFFDETRFFRVIKGFMAQFGIPGLPAVAAKWRSQTISDDKVVETNTQGKLTFATSGPNSRTTQLFLNFGDNSFLDRQGFAPIGQVSKGMDVVDALYSGYGEGGRGDGTDGKGPSQGRCQSEGNAYLASTFPKLSYIRSARLLKLSSSLSPP